MRHAILAAIVFFVVSVSLTAHADQWFISDERWSENGKFLLQNDDSKSTLTLKEKRYFRLQMRWRISYSDKGPVESNPVYWHVTNDGKYVVFRNQRSQLGYGNVLVFLDTCGKVLAYYTLNQFLSESEINETVHSVSSIWWDECAIVFIREAQKQFAFQTRCGTLRAFDLTTGRRLKLTKDDVVEIRAEAIQIARRMLKSSRSEERSTGAVQVGILKDRESVPTLKRLLEDRRSTSIVIVSPSSTSHLVFRELPEYTTYGVQLCAGEGLLALIGKEAIPLIKARMKTANPYMRDEWKSMLGRFGNPHSLKPLYR